jgi:putative toxin-antitoxin system antitoxin component (TIGR02293 family)
MSDQSATVLTAREPTPPWVVGKTAASSASALWRLPAKATGAAPRETRKALQELVGRVAASPGVSAFDAVEAGVPTALVHLIAHATGQPVNAVMDLVGVSATTFRRKEEAGEPLPDVSGHRLMAFLRLAATLRRLLQESGDATQLASFDLETWLGAWMREPLPQLGNKSPATLLRNPEGQRLIEQVLDRMRGGLPA